MSNMHEYAFDCKLAAVVRHRFTIDDVDGPCLFEIDGEEVDS